MRPPFVCSLKKSGAAQFFPSPYRKTWGRSSERRYVWKSPLLLTYDLHVFAEFCKKLETGAAGDAGIGAAARYGDSRELPVSLTDRFSCGGSFRADGEGIGCIFDIASCKKRGRRRIPERRLPRSPNRDDRRGSGCLAAV